MKLNGTLMSSFLFNTGLIQMCSVAVIQFCATAFDIYAKETAIAEIFGGEVRAAGPHGPRVGDHTSPYPYRRARDSQRGPRESGVLGAPLSQYTPALTRTRWARAGRRRSRTFAA